MVWVYDKDTGWGLVLHERCADRLAKLSREEYAEMAVFVRGVRAW